MCVCVCGGGVEQPGVECSGVSALVCHFYLFFCFHCADNRG